MPASKHKEHIAVVGVSALFPGSVDKDGFWKDILAGRDLVTDVPPTHWLIEDYYDPDPAAPDKTYSHRGAFLPQVDFDPVAWGVPPSIVPATDTTQLLALIVARKVLEDACRGDFSGLDRERVSVILGVTSAQELLGSMVSRLQRPVWVKALREMGMPEDEVEEACARIAAHYVPWQESTFPGVLGNVVAGRIANRLDLGGTNCVTDAACASSFSALAMGIAELRLGESDMVITGGADTMNDIFMYMCFSKTPALSPTGDCRPFSDRADGTLLGEGLGMVALKRLADAERDGDRIYALITGVGSSSDGRAKSVYAPVPEGQAKALRRAYHQAGYGPETVELVEAHGTGTKAGDAAEFGGLEMVWNEADRTRRQWCALGSVKSQVGHTKAAAGAAGLFKAIMAVHHGILPPTLKVDRPNPALKLAESPFYLNTRARPWIRNARHPRRAGVSSFGFGGSNFHVTVEEYRGPGEHAARVRARASELVLLSAPSDESLAVRCRALLDEAAPAGALAFLAWSTQQQFDHQAAVRVAIEAADEAELLQKLKTVADLLAQGRDVSTPTGVHIARGRHHGRIALLFPGQGSQYVDMAADLVMQLPSVQRVWDEAAGLLEPLIAGEPLHHIVFPRPAFDEPTRLEQKGTLTRTEWAQPAIGVTSWALLALVRRLGLSFEMSAGHSFGEVTALLAAGRLSPGDFLRVACARGRLMSEAARTPGAMSSIAASLEDVRALLAVAGDDVVIANHNGPSQVVVSGPTEAVARCEALAAERGFAVTRLQVATAFHSPVVSDSVTPFARMLETVPFAPATLPVFSNSEALPYPDDQAAARALLAAQLSRPVRFVEQIRAMYQAGARTFIEVGPSGVLTNLVGRILGSEPHLAVALDRPGRPGVASLHHALARLAVAGVAIDFSPLWEGHEVPADPRTVLRPKMTLQIGGSSYDKPYPPREGAAALPKPNPPRTEMKNQSDAHARSQQPLTDTAPKVAAPVAAPPAPASHPGVDAQVQLAWMQAFMETQRYTAEAHAAYQRAMADTHAAFLRASELSLAALGGFVNPGAVAVVAAPTWPPLEVASPPPVPATVAPPPIPPAVAPPAFTAAAAMPAAPSLAAVTAPAPMSVFAPAPSDAMSSTPPAMTTMPPAPAVAIAPAKSDFDLAGLILSVVAEKTGYPQDMLGLDMNLEGDLGIDSIKRVEILSAVSQRAPQLPEFSAADMAGLHTLGEIIAFLAGQPPPRDPPSPGGGRRSDGAGGSERAGRDDAAAEAGEAGAVGRHGLRLVRTAAAGFATAGLFTARRLVVTDEGCGIAPALVERLSAARIEARVVDEVPPDADAVIVLAGLRVCDDGGAAREVNREAFAAARTVAARFSQEGGTLVLVQDTGGDFGLSGSPRAWLAGPAALARTARIEWPMACVRAIDIERGQRTPAEVAAALATELLEGGGDWQVGLRADGTRSVPDSFAEPLNAETPALALSERSVVVASGGGRGVTAPCLIALARRYGCKFLLLGRTSLSDEPACCHGLRDEAALMRALRADAAGQADLTPAALGRRAQAVLAAREIRATVDAIAAAGGQARYVAVDITDPAQVNQAVDAARAAWGPITAVVHAAGVLQDKLISEKTDEQWARVFDTKVRGLEALLAATRSDDLRALVMFSSIAARAGNRGQCDYAMANEVLNKVARSEQRRRGDGVVVRSLNWGPWDGGMVTPGLKAHFAALGVPLIPIEDGAAHFVDELSGKGMCVEPVVGAPPPGNGLIDSHGREAVTLALEVGRAHQPFLADHAVAGVPVVPAALVIEWFCRAAAACRPDLKVAACQGLAVLRGIRLHDFAGAGHRFSLRVRQLANGSNASLAVELLGADGGKHYTATVEMKPRLPVPAHQPPRLPPLAPFAGPIYGEVLFHGPAFQLLRAVDELADDGARAVAFGVRESRWPGIGESIADPALIDAGLQLALLWTQRVLGGPSLPTAVAEFHTFVERPAPGPLHVVLKAVEKAGDRARCDVFFTTADGAILAELRGVETHRLPRQRGLGDADARVRA